jgi:hypothetical protein
LLELFDTVRSQAEQYRMVYETLLRKAYELDRLRATSYQEFDWLKHSVEELSNSLRAAVEAELEQFRDKIAHVERTYAELSEITHLRDNLVKLEERFTKRTIELDAVLMSIRQMVETATAERFTKLEDYIANKLRAIEQDVSTLDSHIYAMQEFFKKEIADLSEDLARYKKKIPETRYILDETNKYIVSVLDDAERRFYDKLDEVSAAVDERIGAAVNQLHGNIELANELARANARAQELVKRADALERRMSVSVWISLILGGVALILALITILS